MANEKVEKDAKEKKDKKDKKEGKDKDKKKGVTFVHERLTELPPPRYPVGQEPALPPWPIIWTPISICLESSVPGLSMDILAENFNKLARPGMSMVMVHPKDLAEDEMAVEGTVLAEMLKKAKELDPHEPQKSYRELLLLSVFAARSILDRDNEHRNEELCRASAVVAAKQASEDFKAKLAMAKEEVTLAETKLKDYRTKLLEEMRAKKAERKLASMAVSKVDATNIGETDLSKGGAKQDESKAKKVEDKEKKEVKVGKKQDKDKPVDKGERGQKGKTGENEPEPVLVPIASPQDQFKLYEEEVIEKKAFVKEIEAKLLSSVENEAIVSSTLLEPFTTGRLYCVLGMDSALPMIQLACEEKSLFKAIFNVAPKPKDSSILSESEGQDKARDDDVSGLTSSSKSESKSEKRAAKKEAKLAKKEAKVAVVAIATPPLVTEIKAIVKNGSVMDPARSVCVMDVFYETPLSPESNGDGGESKNQEKVLKQKDGVGDKKRKEDGKNKTEKKVKAGKEGQEVVGDKGDEEKAETKGKKSKTHKKAAGAKDETLPYEQIAQAVVTAIQRLLLQVQLYGDMGGDKVKIFKVPEAKPFQEEDRTYYNHLLNKFPRGLVTVPIILHCLLEQVATYQWPVEDTKAIEILNLNKQLRNSIYHEFEKCGHPKWIGVQEDVAVELPTRFEGPFNTVQMEIQTPLHSKVTTSKDVAGAQVQEKIVDGSIVTPGGDAMDTSITQHCEVHCNKTVSCDIHKSLDDEKDGPVLRKGRVTKVYDPHVHAKEFEDKLNVAHEFDTITQLSAILKPLDLDFADSVNATKVGQHLSMLRATPARSRYKMPGVPMYSEEKMGASLTALQDLCDHYEDDKPRFKSLEDALFHCKDLGPSKAVDINTMQRYKKLTTFLEMIKEDKDVFPELDIPVEEVSCPDQVTKGPYDLEEMKYWCSNCLAFFKRPDVMEAIPKEPLTDEELSRLKKMFEQKLVNDYEKRQPGRQLDKDQSQEQEKEESSPIDGDGFSQEMIEAGIFSEEQVKDRELSERELDPKVVKMWCKGCQSVFLPPPPPTLEEIFKEGERMREEMERIAAREAQAVIDAKIEAWKRLEQKLRKSILGRLHAEGFADGLMGEVYARAKLQLPFEIIRYDHDEDCILTCLYAASKQRNVQEQIPCLVPFGDFCSTYHLASGEPIKKKFAVYEMEPRYTLVLDERRYLLTEQQGLVICGLPAKSVVQHEPRATIYKDGNVIMLRSIKAEEMPEKTQEETEKETGLDSGKEGDQGTKVKIGGTPLQTGKLKTKGEEQGDKKTTAGKMEEKDLGKEAKRQDKAKKGKEEADVLEDTSGAVQEQVAKDHAGDLPNDKQGLVDSDPELERTVIACLKDGLIATFFFAKDATLHLQIHIPGGSRTFEITSKGVVIFLPLDNQNQEPKPALDTSTASDSHTPKSMEDLKHEGKKTPSREVSPSKEKGGGEKSKQKKKEDNAGKDGEPSGEPGIKSKKKGAKGQPEKPGKEEKEGLDEDGASGTRGAEGQLSNDLEFINALYKKGVGDMEVSRCILPSGTVVSYKENGSSQDPPTKRPAVDDEVVVPEDTMVTGKAGKGKNKGAEKEKSKGAKQQEPEAKPEKDPKTKGTKVGKDTKQLDSKKDRHVIFAEQGDGGESLANPAASNPIPPPVAAERSHVQLPSKKVVEILDPDSGSSILTREDLVVVMNTNDKTVRMVQHADGTHIYSEVKETIEEYNPSAGQICLEKTKEFSSSSKLQSTNPSVGATTSIPLASIESEIDPTPITYIKTGGVHIVGDNGLNSAESGQLTNSGVAVATEVFQAKKRFYSAQWHVRKEGFPHVHGNTNGGVAVEFTTTDGQYCVTWSRESGNISVLMPKGSMIYSCGKLVNFDASDGTKRSDPKQSLHNQPIWRPSFINTNGIYEFNLERANLTFTDNSGNGFRSSWGYKVELITNGVLQKPPKPVDPLSEGLKLPDTGESLITTDGNKQASLKAAAPTINPEVPAAISSNKEPSANATGRSKALQIQPTRSSQVGPPLSPISKSPTFESDISLTMIELGQVSESPSFESSNEETKETEEPMVGPSARLFVLHEGGFGFEIIHETEFNKYTSSKKWSQDCTHVREVYEEVSAVLHTFVTVEEKAKKLAEVFVQAQEGCRAPDTLKLWTTTVAEFAKWIKLRAIETKMHKRTKCNWLQINLNLPYLPRVVAPDLPPVLPLSNVTKVVFRQIFEYPSFLDEQIPRMERILETYNKWQENAMILMDVEQNPDTRTEEEIKLAHEVAKTIREVHAEKKLHDARDRAAVEVEHAKEIFREMMNAEAERLARFEESKIELRRKGESDWLQYKESKKGPLPCLHKPHEVLQIKGPYRPEDHVRLCYFDCEEGLQYIVSLQVTIPWFTFAPSFVKFFCAQTGQYQPWQQHPEDPRRWSVEALPPFSYSYQGSSTSQSSGEHHEEASSVYEVPCIAPQVKEEGVQKEAPCLLSEWMRELEVKPPEDVEEDEEKMCWELIEPERKELGPADWTPCFLAGFDEKCEESDGYLIIDRPEANEVNPASTTDKEAKEPYVEAEEIGAKVPLPDLPPNWSIPKGEEWEINHKAVQRQSELIPNFPGWRKAGWRQNKAYLDINLETFVRVNNSSIGTLHQRPRPPKDWSRQFVVVPDFLDFGKVEYGSISMKVLFLQNYHGTEPGRFRFDNLGQSVKFLYELGMVPPGLSRAVRIFFRASALGCFNHEIRIFTRYDVFEVPIVAEVVKPKGY